MHFRKWAFAGLAAATMIAGGQAEAQNTPASDQATLLRAAKPPAKPIEAWAQKPTKLAPYIAPNKLVYRLADVLAAHKGQQSAEPLDPQRPDNLFAPAPGQVAARGRFDGIARPSSVRCMILPSA